MTTAAPTVIGKVIADEESVVRRDERREQVRILGLALPAFLIVALLLLTPLGWLLYQSFVDQSGAATLTHYERIWNDTAYRSTFWLTFQISVLVTVLAILIGYPLSYLLSQLTGKWATIGLALVIVPFWTSLLVRTYAWLVLLQRNGIINNVLIDLEVISEPLKLVHNFTGTVIGMLHIMLPFMVLPLYASMKRIDLSLMRAASNLGASPVHAFWQVFFPLSRAGLMAGTLLVFVLCLGFYITPEILGGGHTIMISMLVQRNVELYFEWGAASSVAIVLLVMVLVVFVFLNRVLAVERVFGAR
jgi:ABC-type spermidine/putrescine transport system permease subunit I